MDLYELKKYINKTKVMYYIFTIIKYVLFIGGGIIFNYTISEYLDKNFMLIDIFCMILVPFIIYLVLLVYLFIQINKQNFFKKINYDITDFFLKSFGEYDHSLDIESFLDNIEKSEFKKYKIITETKITKDYTVFKVKNNKKIKYIKVEHNYIIKNYKNSNYLIVIDFKYKFNNDLIILLEKNRQYLTYFNRIFLLSLQRKYYKFTEK